jgi:hypothetical protein
MLNQYANDLAKGDSNASRFPSSLVNASRTNEI